MDNNPIRDIEAEAQAAGVSIHDALSAAGVSPTTWWRWSEGKFEPRLSTLRRIRTAIDQRAASRLQRTG